MVNQKEQKNSKLYGAIGEIALLFVALTVTYLIGFFAFGNIEVGLRLTLCMVGLLTFKQFYKNSFHARKPHKWIWNWYCTAITYGILFILILLTWSYKTEFSLILLTVGIISYGNAKLGEWQQSYYKKLNYFKNVEIENKSVKTQNILLTSKSIILECKCNELTSKLITELKPKQKPLKAMNKDEFIEYCLMGGLDDVEIKIAELFIIQNLKGKELYDACGYSEAQLKRKRKNIKNKLNI